MELTNEFVIDRDVEETWRILNDLEFIAPCMPGAQLTEIEGEVYRGLVKIKVGPITANYKGKASFIEQDAVKKVARLKAEGRDPRQGNANALVTAEMTPVGDSQTNVKIHTDLGLSGKIASFGRGAIEDISKKILNQFTENLRAKLEAGGDDGGEQASPTTETGADPTQASVVGSEPAASAGTEAAAVGSAPAAVNDLVEGAENRTNSASGVRKIEGPEAEPVDLFEVSQGAMVKRALPAAGGVALLLAIIYWIIR